jgi:hypothetical protein
MIGNIAIMKPPIFPMNPTTYIDVDFGIYPVYTYYMKSPMERALDLIEAEIAELEKEWEKLDSQGVHLVRQKKISDLLFDLNRARAWAKTFLERRKK